MHGSTKRREDASSRRFFDEFLKVRVSRFRADGTIDPAKSQAVIPFPDGASRLIGTKHTWFKKGGGWSYFVCPGCARRASTLYLVGQAPRCRKCCDKLSIKYRTMYGFGRNERRRASDVALDQIIGRLETTEPLRLNGTPESWYGKAKQVYRSKRLTAARRRRMITLRLDQLAQQYAMKDGLVTAWEPIEPAKQLLDLKPIFRARSVEKLEQALDAAQSIIIAALNSNDPNQRLNAAKLLLRTKQARERGL